MAEESKSRSRLRDSPIGAVEPISGHDARFGEEYEADAFIPHDLPDRIDLPGPTWMAVSDAAAELGRLDAAASLIPRPQLIARIATRREAIGTSALEGTYANLTELFAAEVLPEASHGTDVAPNVREVMNYTRAADTAYSWIGDRRPPVLEPPRLRGHRAMSELRQHRLRSIPGSPVRSGRRHRIAGGLRALRPDPTRRTAEAGREPEPSLT